MTMRAVVSGDISMSSRRATKSTEACSTPSGIRTLTEVGSMARAELVNRSLIAMANRAADVKSGSRSSSSISWFSTMRVGISRSTKPPPVIVATVGWFF